MNNKRILWFQDGVKLKTPQRLWREIDMLNHRLIALSGNVGFDHLIVDPIAARERLLDQLNLNNFTCIIDLSGFFSETPISTDIPIVSEFHLSRMRVVSSPRLDGSGFLLSLNHGEIKNITARHDLRKPLIVDDVSWSGRTISEAMKIMDISPNAATIGLLSVNCGTFGEGKPGARDLLEQKGTTVVAGSVVNTPLDDGFHLIDFFNLSPIEPAFDVILEIQKIREDTTNVPEKEKTAGEKIKHLIEMNRTLLFPHAISTEGVKKLEAEGRFVSLGGVSRNSFFDINPPNWLLLSFSERTNWSILQRNKMEIVSVLSGLNAIMNEGLIIKEQETSRRAPESGIIIGKEREL